MKTANMQRHEPWNKGKPVGHDQTHGLRLQGLQLLVPENQGRLPRENAMSQRKAPKCLFYLSALHQLWALCTAMGEVATLGSPAIAFCS